MIQLLTPLLTLVFAFYLAAVGETLKSGAKRRVQDAPYGSEHKQRALRARTRAELVRATAAWIALASIAAFAVAALLEVTQ